MQFVRSSHVVLRRPRVYLALSSCSL